MCLWVGSTVAHTEDMCIYNLSYVTVTYNGPVLWQVSFVHVPLQYIVLTYNNNPVLNINIIIVVSVV